MVEQLSFTNNYQETDVRQCLNLEKDHYYTSHQKLSRYWAQEFIGADLLKEEIKFRTSQENYPQILIIDYFGNSDGDCRKAHGMCTRNVVAGKERSAVLPPPAHKDRIMHGFAYDSLDVLNVLSFQNNNIIFDVLSSLNLIDKVDESSFPSYINMSLGFTSGIFGALYSTLKKIAPYSVLVTSAGNDQGRISGLKDKVSRDVGSIIVGAIGYDGMISHLSNEGEGVTILAPGTFVASSNYKGEFVQYGGTSAASPLAQASLAGFNWMSGFRPNHEQIHILLEKTSIPTPHSRYEKPQRNGVGVINAYKLGRVARKLKNACRAAQNPKACFDSKIREDSTYAFPLDTASLQKIDKVFPGCGIENREAERNGESNPVSANCEETKRLFKAVRKNVLLNQNDPEMWKTLACIYRLAGVNGNARTADTVYRALTTTDPLDFIQYAFHSINRTKSIRLLKNLEEKEFQDPKLISFLDGMAESARAMVYETLKSYVKNQTLGVSGAIDIVENLANKKNKYRYAYLAYLYKLSLEGEVKSSQEALRLIKILNNVERLRRAGHLSAKDTVTLLNATGSHPHKSIAKRASKIKQKLKKEGHL